MNSKASSPSIPRLWNMSASSHRGLISPQNSFRKPETDGNHRCANHCCHRRSHLRPMVEGHVARNLGVHACMLNRWLQRRGRPTFDDLYRLLAVARARYSVVPEAHELAREVLTPEPLNLAFGGRFNPPTAECLTVSSGFPGLS